MTSPGNVRIDHVEMRVEAAGSSIAQRDDLLAALKRALPPGRWVRAVHVDRADDGALRMTVERQTVV